MPAPAAAWVEALLGVYSHEGVKIAAVATGLFDLRAAQQSDKGLQARFDRAYEIVLRWAKEGQPLDGKIATGIGHDSQKNLVQLADEYASQRQARLLEIQQIPSGAAACRAHLLAKLNIKRRAAGRGGGVMNRASPVEMRKAMETANTLAKAGLLFVCVPVMNESDYDDLVHLSKQRLGELVEKAEAEEKR
ncbi:hypothetical protein D3C76_837200 [compost metagenome]